MLAVGNLQPPFGDVRRIALLRAGGLGDLIFAIPAAESLAAAYPDAELVLLGSPLHAELLRGRPAAFHQVEVVPPWPGVRAGPDDPAAVTAFFERMRRTEFDLAVQVHGGGRNSNPFLLRLGARHTVGSATSDAPPLERTLPYVYYQHEVLRALEVAALAGAAPAQLEPRLRLTDEETALAGARAARPVPRVLIHPGATDPRRRWPAESFTALAGQLAAAGAEVVVIGDESDVETAEQIVSRARPASVSSVAGQTSLSELIPLLLTATVVVANDSGPRHIAAALGTATVGIYWLGNLINAGPLSRGRHRVQLSWTTHCPVCGRDTTREGAERCEHDVSFVADVELAAVLADVRALLNTS